jgi:hypothetical protein
VRRCRKLAAVVLGAIAISSPAAARPYLACPPGKAPDWAQTSNSNCGDFAPVCAGLPSGEVTLSCVAGGADGKLYDCEVVDERPANQGLGLWALHVALDFRLKRPGCPADGARLTIPLRFDRPDQD